jgi:hypothetical protein
MTPENFRGAISHLIHSRTTRPISKLLPLRTVHLGND